MGCAAYAQSLLLPNGTPAPPPRNVPFSAYQGRDYSSEQVASAIAEYMPWLEEVALEDSSEAGVVQYAAKALASGEIICWVHGKAEVGARALGHRSILADPRAPTTHKRVNTIKRREQYRPLAPSVLAEHADEWFDGVPSLGSPYMQITAAVRPQVQEEETCACNLAQSQYSHDRPHCMRRCRARCPQSRTLMAPHGCRPSLLLTCPSTTR